MRQRTHPDALPHPEPEPRSETCLERPAGGSHPVRLRLCLTDVRPRRLLRLLAAAARDPAPQGDLAPGDADFEPGEDGRRRFVDHTPVRPGFPAGSAA